MKITLACLILLLTGIARAGTNYVESVEASSYVSTLRLTGSGGIPTVVTNAGAGTSLAAVTTFALGGTTNDFLFGVELTGGVTPPANTNVFTVTFAQAFTNTPGIMMTPVNAAAANLTRPFYVDSTNVTTTSFKVYAGTTAAAQGTIYRWNFHVIGR